jgi:hypothetical protein
MIIYFWGIGSEVSREAGMNGVPIAIILLAKFY